jgi:hypothetical protein
VEPSNVPTLTADRSQRGNHRFSPLVAPAAINGSHWPVTFDIT